MKREGPQGHRLIRWVRRLGAGGFVFFFVKGMLWLAIPWGLSLLR